MESEGQRSKWVELRDARGRLQARYDPVRRLLEIQDRGFKTLHDLSQWDEGE